MRRLLRGSWIVVSALLFVGCAAGSRSQMASISAKQDSLLRKVDEVNRRLDAMDSTRDDLRKIRLLTDFVGARLARQERQEKMRDPAETAARSQEISQGNSFAEGPESAPVVMVTFSDLECPFCKSLGPVLDSFARAHRGDLRWIAKNLPLDMHPNARSAAVAAIAAGRQGRYFEFLARSASVEGPLVRERLEEVARGIGLDMKRFRTDLANPLISEPLLAAEMNEADDLGVRATPTVFLNGRIVHARTISDLENEYQTAIARKSDSRERK